MIRLELTANVKFFGELILHYYNVVYLISGLVRLTGWLLIFLSFILAFYYTFCISMGQMRNFIGSVNVAQ